MVKPKDFKMQIISFNFMRSCKLYYRPLQDQRKLKNLQQEMMGFNHTDNRCSKLSLTMSNSMLTSTSMSISISMYSQGKKKQTKKHITRIWKPHVKAARRPGGSIKM